MIPTAVGGGFGGKLDLSLQPLVCARRVAAAPAGADGLHAARSMVATTKRHPARIAAGGGATRDGRLTAMGFSGDFNTGAYASWGPTVANRVPVHATGPYACRITRGGTARSTPIRSRRRVPRLRRAAGAHCAGAALRHARAPAWPRSGSSSASSTRSAGGD